MGGVCLSVYITHTHTRTHILQHFIYNSPSAYLCPHSSLSYPLIPLISKPPIQSTSPQFSYSWCLMMFILLSSSHFFPLLSQIFPRLFPKITHNISYVYFLKRTCVRYLAVHVADTEPSVQLYRGDGVSQTAMKLQQRDSRISELLHFIPDGKRYTEHIVDMYSNRM